MGYFIHYYHPIHKTFPLFQLQKGIKYWILNSNIQNIQINSDIKVLRYSGIKTLNYENDKVCTVYMIYGFVWKLSIIKRYGVLPTHYTNITDCSFRLLKDFDRSVLYSTDHQA